MGALHDCCCAVAKQLLGNVAGETGSTRADAVRRVKSIRLTVLALVAVSVGAAAYIRAANRPARYYRRALEALDSGDLERACRELPRLKAHREYLPHASLIAGMVLLEQQKPEAALEELRFASDHGDTRVKAWTLIGRTQYQQHQFLPAERALKKALQFDPQAVEAHRWLGTIYLEVGAMPEGVAHLKKVAELVPTDPKPNQMIAFVMKMADAFDEAAVQFQEALRRDDEFPGGLPAGERRRILLELAQCQIALARHQDALATLRDVPETAASLSLRADCFEALGDVEKSRACIDRALRLDVDHFPSLLAKARASLDCNDPAAALEALGVAVQRRPQDQTVNYLLSQAYQRTGDHEAAKKHLEEFNRIRVLKQAYVELARRATQEKQPWLCFELGQQAEGLGLFDEAASWYRAVLILDPKQGEARARLSVISESQGGQRP